MAIWSFLLNQKLDEMRARTFCPFLVGKISILVSATAGLTDLPGLAEERTGTDQWRCDHGAELQVVRGYVAGQIAPGALVKALKYST